MAVLLVDVANVVGSRPDGWWRDRAGATTRLLERLAGLDGRTVAAPDGAPLQCEAVVAVVEGAARDVPPVPQVRLVRAQRSGDDALASEASALDAGGHVVLVVTADRGLRARLPVAVDVAGPGWLRARLDEVGAG